ncbi:MAG: type IV secretion system protein [Lactobacillaceae bacterium]|jgi:type IV secretory pathway component VirB8|nr:type IV secretion system protein [Lactobacillaceae bacterium]
MFGIFRTIFKYREKQSPDVLGRYPELVHVSAMPERRYLWTSRILIIIACVGICINMMLASTIYLMLPQRNVAPQFFGINKYFSELERLEPDELNIPVTDLIIEQYVTEYILFRYLVSSDYDELMTRWGRGGLVYWYSTPQVYQNFAENDVKFNIMMFRQNKLKRNVEIDWIRPTGRWLWQAQFKTLDYIPGRKEPDINIWRANMRVSFIDMKLKRKNTALINPYGFTVTNFSLGYQGKPGSSASYMENIKARMLNDYRRF